MPSGQPAYFAVTLKICEGCGRLFLRDAAERDCPSCEREQAAIAALHPELVGPPRNSQPLTKAKLLGAKQEIVTIERRIADVKKKKIRPSGAKPKAPEVKDDFTQAFQNSWHGPLR